MRVFGVPLPGPLSVVGAAVGTARGVVSLMGTPPPRVVAGSDHLYVDVHGIHGEGGARIARRIERAVEAHPGVAWARVNGPSSRLCVAVTEPRPRPSEIAAIVRRAGSTPAAPDDEAAEDEIQHPADGLRGTRVVPTLAVDLLGFVMSLLTRIAPWAPLPPEVAALIGVAEHHPAAKDVVARRARSHTRADSLTSMTGAIAQGLAAGNEGIVLDVVQRVGQWREARALWRAWWNVEQDVVTGPDAMAAEVLPTARPPREGEVERYQRTALRAGLVAGTAALPFLGPRKALAVGLSTVPKAAETGRSAFGSALGRVLGRRGTVVMDRSVLRHLDCVDAVVLDRAALSTGRLALSDLVALPDADPHEVAERAWRLFGAGEQAETEATDGDWWLGPVDGRELDGPRGERERERLAQRGAARVLGLGRGRRLHAVLGLRNETLPGAHLLSLAAQHSRLPVHETDDPVGAVRDLQHRGYGVLLVSGDCRALAMADCGAGVQLEGQPQPWGAHVLVGTDLGTAALLIEAVGAMKTMNAQSVRISQTASGVGMVAALRGGRTNPTSRAMHAVNAGAAVALVNARRHAARLREPRAVEVADTVPWHAMPVTAVLERLSCSDSGLTEREAARRKTERGGAREPGTSFGSAFLAELTNPLTPVLAGGAALSAAVGSPTDAGLVAAVIGISALVGSFQQLGTERRLADLLRRSSVSATVVRDGDERVLTAEDLVPGDLVALTAGDVVPADCRVVEASGFEVDESSLTGESLPVAKTQAPVVASEVAERSSMVYEGTTVAAGQATAVVVAVGDDTQAGRSMATAREAAPTTGVESRLTELTQRSLPLAVGSAAAVAGSGLLRGVPLRESMGAAVNLAVASVPEGLPFLVNAAQLAAARRLAELGALVRNPRSIEALGRVDVLCFDKTGTLTEGRLSVSEVDDGHVRSRVDTLTESLRPVLAAALRATPHSDVPEELPHATDRAVAEAGARLAITAGSGASGWREFATVPFEPSRGFHATVGRTRKGLLLSVKGAPEEVLPRCDVDARTRRRLSARLRTLAQAGHRVLAVAERPIEGDSPETGWDEDSVTGLRFLGFLAIADPVRGSAAPAAARLRDAGVHIVMLTGDHPATGEAIAAEINGHDDGLHVITGAELDELDEAGLREILPGVDVIARCTPAHKVRIVEAYRALGRTVAMTGDGANDAPAIRLADVGIALGGRGTPAARAAADVVVADDKLETIIAALVEGRAMWASVRSALGVLLGGNLGEIAFNVLGAALTGRSPLNARQLLLVNLLTDLAPSMAIASRPPAGDTVDDLLREGPESSLGKPLYSEIGVRAGTTTLGATAAWTLARFTGRRRRASTVALAALVGTQLAQTLAEGWRSPAVLASGLGSAAVLAGLVQTPVVSHFFGCTPLGPVGWTTAVGSAAAATALGALAS